MFKIAPKEIRNLVSTECSDAIFLRRIIPRIPFLTYCVRTMYVYTRVFLGAGAKRKKGSDAADLPKDKKSKQ